MPAGVPANTRVDMSRARVLAPQELRQLLGYIAQRRHALRNATQVLLTYWAGLRVGEIAELRYSDVVDGNRRRIHPEMIVPQGARPSRTVLLSARMRRQLANYVNAFPPASPDQPLFYTQKRAHWTANTLAQHFLHLYRSAGIEGASSQSGRRTFVTTLARRGVDTRLVRALAGHRRVEATRAAIEPADPLRAAIERI